jgi:hypothetical protein
MMMSLIDCTSYGLTGIGELYVALAKQHCMQPLGRHPSHKSNAHGYICASI